MKTGTFVRRYPSEHYSTLFNNKTGFFARIEDEGFPEPHHSQHGPELIDIAITNYCDRGCSFCYRSSSVDGKHMDIEDYQRIIKQASELGVLQVALGGGNPNQHPHFVEILELTRKAGIIPSYSTNGRGLSDKILHATKDFCGSVAVSAYSPFGETEHAVSQLLSSDVTPYIHFILSRETLSTAIKWLNQPPNFLLKSKAIVFLNYKPIGRPEDDDLLLKNDPRVQLLFRMIGAGNYPFRIGFDSCSTSGIVKYASNIPSLLFDACESARFSMFISESLKMYPCSFMESYGNGISLKSHNIIDTWLNSALFLKIRDALTPSYCPSCSEAEICLGGCPFFKTINLC